jgi:tRNA uridine 5-carbamoylmethylation protein Kti12
MIKNKIRICLYGGPGIGKSTLAHTLISRLKQEFPALNAEFVDEWVKQWAYEGKRPTGWDQLFIFGNQVHKEERLLKNGIDLIIADSPVLLQCCYMHGLPFQQQLIELSQMFDKQFPAIHVLLERQDFGNFNTVGRYQSNLEESLAKDREIEEIVEKRAIGQIVKVKVSNGDYLYNHIVSNLDFSH